MTIADEMRASTPCGKTTGHGSICAEPWVCGECRQMREWAASLEAEAKHQSSGWQPIETAPKDGTWVLLSGGLIDYGWEHGATKPSSVVGQWNDDASCWQFAWYDGGYYGEYENPTKWQPLPAS